jgi:nucleoside-diphosphate-sugar epimerase
MIAIAQRPELAGEVFNVSADSVDANRYVAVLAAVAGADAQVVYVPDELLPEAASPMAPPVFSHLFKARHHAALSTAKAERAFGYSPVYDLAAGHADTFEWFRAQGYAELHGPLTDPVWKASWDFDAEAALAERISRG